MSSRTSSAGSSASGSGWASDSSAGTSSRSSSSHGSGSAAGASALPARRRRLERLDVERLALVAGYFWLDRLGGRLVVGGIRASGFRRGIRVSGFRKFCLRLRAQHLALLTLHLARIGAAGALELQMLSDGVVEQSHRRPERLLPGRDAVNAARLPGSR